MSALKRCSHRLGVLALLLSVAAQALAATESDGDKDIASSWRENALQLPAAPLAENLITYYAGPQATQTFAIDAKSLSVGSDGVVRYTLVAKSAAGAQSVSYEGIRCETLEMRWYAFGQKDGAWSQARSNVWRKIPGFGVNRQHAALALDYFCENKSAKGNAQEIVQRIRSGQAITP